MAGKKENGTTAITAIKGEDQIVQRQASIADRAKSIEVRDKVTAETAAEVRNAARQLLKQIDETFDPLIKQAHDHHKALLATKKKHADPINVEIINPLNAKLLDYNRRVDKERQEEQARLQEIAKKDQEDRRVNEARELKARGDHEAADQVIEDAITETAPVVQVQKEKIAGVTFRDVWRWEITDVAKIPTNYLSVEVDTETGCKTRISTAGIGAIVRAVKHEARVMAMIPGIKVWKDTVSA
jgi:hypothetical protein